MIKSSLMCVLGLSLILGVGCGMKVIHPDDVNKNAGTLALDIEDGRPKLVETYSCNLKSMGNRFTAVKKTEDEARKEVLAMCKDRTLLSYCQSEKVTCVKN